MQLNLAGIFSKAISIIVGLMFIIIGLLLFFNYDPAAYDIPTKGVIVEITDYYEDIGDESQLTHTVYIDYSADGTTYRHVELGEYNSKMKVGDEVDIFYMSSDPAQFARTDKGMTPYFGLIAAVIGAAILVITVIKAIKKSPV